MLFHSKWRVALLTAVLVVAIAVAWQGVMAEDVVHAVSGVVKSVDKGTKTVVVKTADGTEQTIKYTSKTTVEGAKEAAKGTEKASAGTYLGAKKGAKVTVQYTEKGAEKTAVAVKDAVD
jgi:hypothetical protein